MTAAAGAARYRALFERLRAGPAPRGALVPFVVLGDPDLETSLEVIRALLRGGADALELGLPFSDPVADGPVIQAAAVRALAAGAAPARCWELLARVRAEAPDVPLGLLVYANLVVGPGLERFYRRAAEAGVDSVLVADVPTLEAAPFVAAARARGVAPVLIAPSNASDARLDAIARDAEAYVYVVTRKGVTGADRELDLRDAQALLARLRARAAAPALLGFGISRPEHVRAALAAGAAGAISGSAVVAHVARFAAGALDRPGLLAAVEGFVAGLAAATRPGPGGEGP